MSSNTFKEGNPQTPEQITGLYRLWKESLDPGDRNRAELAGKIKKILRSGSGNKQIEIISPTGLAIGALSSFTGERGTKELYGLNLTSRSIALALGEEIVNFYTGNSELLVKDLRASGLVNNTEETRYQYLTRSGKGHIVNNLILQKIGEAHEKLLQPANPVQSPLAEIFANIKGSNRLNLEAMSGQLVAIEFIRLLRRNVRILPQTDLSPDQIRNDVITFNLDSPTSETATGRGQNIQIPVTSKPETLFVGGPGLGTAGTLDKFIIYPHAIFADQSLFVSSVIASLAKLMDKQVGIDSINDVLLSSAGFEKAAQQFAASANVALFSMVHSASPDTIQQTFQTLSKDLPHGSTVVIMNPNLVYPGETPIDTFSLFAVNAGLEQIQILVNGNQNLEYKYKHPNLTSERKIPGRKVFLRVYRKN